MTARRFAFHGTDDAVQILELKGREEWALSHLLAAGESGARLSIRPARGGRTMCSSSGAAASTSRRSPRRTTARMPAITPDMCCARIERLSAGPAHGAAATNEGQQAAP